MQQDHTTAGEQTSNGLLVAYVLLAIALTCSGNYHPWSLGFALLSFGAVLWALRAAQTARRVALCRNSRALILQYVGLYTLSLLGCVRMPADTDDVGYFALHALICAVCVPLLAVHAVSTPPRQRLLLRAIVAMKVLMWAAGVWVVRTPQIDVWHLQQHAIDYLLSGRNPYTEAVPDVYQGGASFGYQPFYAYAPLNLLLSTPAKVLFGDYRAGMVLALAGALLLLRRSGQALGLSAHRIDLLTFAFVLHPSVPRLLNYGWMEPYLILLLAGFVYLHATGRRGPLATLLLVSMPLVKQYFAVPVLLHFALLRPRMRTVALALLGVFVALSPLLLWNFDATVRHGLLFFVQRTWFRPDSLSVPAAVFHLTGYRSGVLTSFVVQCVAGGVAALLLARARTVSPLARFLLASSTALFASFLAAPQAFLNYYVFVGMTLLWAELALRPPARDDGQDERGALEPPSLRAVLAPALGMVLLTGSVAVVAAATYYHFACARAESVGRGRLAAGRPLLDDGPTQARATDAVYVCQVRHCFGPLCHADLRCVCADRSRYPTADAVIQQLGRRTGAPAVCETDPAPGTPAPAALCRLSRCHERL